MVDVKPDEISAILQQQLSGLKSSSELEEVGTVLQVGDGIARVYGLTKAQAGELVEFNTGVRAIVLNLEEDNVGVVLLGASDGIKEGTTVKRTGTIASIKVGEEFVGRVVNPLGDPIDGKGEIGGTNQSGCREEGRLGGTSGFGGPGPAFSGTPPRRPGWRPGEPGPLWSADWCPQALLFERSYRRRPRSRRRGRDPP